MPNGLFHVIWRESLVTASKEAKRQSAIHASAGQPFFFYTTTLLAPKQVTMSMSDLTKKPGKSRPPILYSTRADPQVRVKKTQSIDLVHGWGKDQRLTFRPVIIPVAPLEATPDKPKGVLRTKADQPAAIILPKLYSTILPANAFHLSLSTPISLLAYERLSADVGARNWLITTWV